MPWALRGEKARLRLVVGQAEDPDGMKAVEWDEKAMQESTARLIGPLFRDVVSQMQALDLYATHVADLDEQGRIYVNGALYLIHQYGQGPKPNVDYDNPYEEGTWKQVLFDRTLGEGVMLVGGSIASVLIQLPHEVEKAQARARALHNALKYHPQREGAELPPRYEDPYQE